MQYGQEEECVTVPIFNRASGICSLRKPIEDDEETRREYVGTGAGEYRVKDEAIKDMAASQYSRWNTTNLDCIVYIYIYIW